MSVTGNPHISMIDYPFRITNCIQFKMRHENPKIDHLHATVADAPHSFTLSSGIPKTPPPISFPISLFTPNVESSSLQQVHPKITKNARDALFCIKAATLFTSTLIKSRLEQFVAPLTSFLSNHSPCPSGLKPEDQ
jgi:hypothetical protein